MEDALEQIENVGHDFFVFRRVPTLTISCCRPLPCPPLGAFSTAATPRRHGRSSAPPVLLLTGGAVLYGREADSNEVQVLYKRRSGSGYGLIIPQFIDRNGSTA